MEPLNNRQKAILETGIDDYIETGEPITSGGLYARHKLGIKPAMIRRELNALDAAGYLSQLHTSGGRVPTQKGYAFLIEELERKPQRSGVPQKTAGNIRSLMAQGSLEEAMRCLSRELHMVSAVYDATERFFYDSGLEELCASDAFTDKDDVLGVLRSMERLPRRVAEWENWNDDKWPVVLVGRNDLIESDALSLVADRVDIGRRRYCIMVVGPMRMNYRGILGLLRNFEPYAV